jgi:hypothetical protein
MNYLHSYQRVVPRDLFNEAKLLKCLGLLYIAAERRSDLTVDNDRMDDGEGFDIQQDRSTGGISVTNVTVTFRGRTIYCYTGLNSRATYPLVATFGDEEAFVFDEGGGLSDEFLSLVPEKPATAE